MKIKYLLAAAGIALLSATSSIAATMTMTHTGSAENGLIGTLGGVAFNVTGFTINSTADTDDVSGIFVDHLTASITLDGLGTYDLITGTRTFANAGVVGFSRAGNTGTDLYNGPTGAWDLMSNVSLTGTANLLQWGSTPSIETSGGTLFFESTSGVDATFTAVVGVAAVPLPAGGLLLLTGLGGLAAFKRRRTVAA